MKLLHSLISGLQIVGCSLLIPMMGWSEEVSNVKFEGTIDIVTIKIQGNKLWLVNGPYELPEEISVMSRDWEPKWSDAKASEPFTDFPEPLKSLEGATVEIRQLKGRGAVTVKEQPTAANQWTVSIEVLDQPPGNDDYAIRITW